MRSTNISPKCTFCTLSCSAPTKECSHSKLTKSFYCSIESPYLLLWICFGLDVSKTQEEWQTSQSLPLSLRSHFVEVLYLKVQLQRVHYFQNSYACFHILMASKIYSTYLQFCGVLLKHKNKWSNFISMKCSTQFRISTTEKDN